MPTPNGVNYLLQFLTNSSNSPIIRDKKQKRTFYVLCPYVCCYVTIRSNTLKGETLISLAKIVIISEIWKDVVRKMMH